MNVSLAVELTTDDLLSLFTLAFFAGVLRTAMEDPNPHTRADAGATLDGILAEINARGWRGVVQTVEFEASDELSRAVITDFMSAIAIALGNRAHFEKRN